MDMHTIIIVEHNAINQCATICKQYWPEQIPLIVADQNTWEAAGLAVAKNLEQNKVPYEMLLFEESKRLHPDWDHVQRVKRRLAQNPHSIALAVGSGSLNDVVKLASYELHRSYCCIATAPSVDGYSSSNAPITIDGFKKTISAEPPAVIIGDIEVLRAAPTELIASGFGDLVAKVAGGGDWLIADTLGIEAIDLDVWNLVQGNLKQRIADPEAIISGDSNKIAQLFTALSETGIAMKRFGNSRPASGGEHLLSHVWEMEALEVSHGFTVALGTLISTAMMEMLMNRESEEISQMMRNAQALSLSSADESLIDSPEILKIVRMKQLDGEALRTRQEHILSHWGTVTQRLQRQLIPFGTLKELLKRGNCPTEPAAIGLSRPMVEKAMRKARLIRERYTVFDLAYQCGMMDIMIDHIAYGNRYFTQFLER